MNVVVILTSELPHFLRINHKTLANSHVILVI